MKIIELCENNHQAEYTLKAVSKNNLSKELTAMNCMKAQSMITPFINNKLNLKEAEEFIDHVSSCPDCREELEVYYALLTAMKQLDEDKNISSDFGQELNQKLERTKEKIFHAKFTYYRKKVILVLTILLVAFFLSIRYAGNTEEEKVVTKSDYHIRYRFPSQLNSVNEQLLQDYLRDEGIISGTPTQTPVQSQVR